MEQIAFYTMAVAATGFALATVVHPNPLKGALSLLGCLLSLACIYVLLSAHLMAAVQAIVYAGGIAVLFVLIVMLISLRPQDQSFIYTGYHKLAFAVILVGATALPVLAVFLRGSLPSAIVMLGLLTAAVALAMFYRASEQRIAGAWRWFYGLSALLFVVGTPVVLLFGKMGELSSPGSAPQPGFGTAEGVGKLLFGKYLITFETTGVLLLAAIVGVVLMAFTVRREKPALDSREMPGEILQAKRS